RDLRALRREIESFGDEGDVWRVRSEEHTSELQSRFDLVCRLLREKKNFDEFSAHHPLQYSSHASVHHGHRFIKCFAHYRCSCIYSSTRMLSHLLVGLGKYSVLFIH